MNNYPHNYFFYEKYPIYNLSRNNSGNSIDIEYLSSLYPAKVKELRHLVEKECDRMDYKGSMMYDECPDKIMFLKKCDEICSLAQCSCSYAKDCPDNAYLKDIVSVMLSDEMYRRRADRRNYFY